MIQFLLNQRVHQEKCIDPNMTVLQFLRSRLGKVGTKEGCGSGDCGACAVVLGELDGDQIRYRSINACLTFLSTLHGKQLITVEDLKEKGERHPVQQALVDHHGSQCGFCTPGFVMSMFALYKNASTSASSEIAHPDRRALIQEALAGNLCRCTGYRPIVDATLSVLQQPTVDQFDRQRQHTIKRLRTLNKQPVFAFGTDTRQTHHPRTIDELADLYLRYPDARLLAGGTDLALEVTQQHQPIERLIYLGEIPGLRQIKVRDNRLELGAAAPLTDCYQVLKNDYPALGDLLLRFGSLQIRNQGTLGGNIGNASPIGDGAPALIALGAQIQLRRGSKTRTLALQDFFLDYRVTALQPGEFIEKILVPRAGDNGIFRCYKISKRMEDDISTLLGCFNLCIDNGKVGNARIAFGGMAATPKRATRCEAALNGALWCRASIELAAQALLQDFTPISDFRSSAAYRRQVAQNLLIRYFTELTTPGIDIQTGDARVTEYPGDAPV